MSKESNKAFDSMMQGEKLLGDLSKSINRVLRNSKKLKAQEVLEVRINHLEERLEETNKAYAKLEALYRELWHERKAMEVSK
jgi:ribosomal protein S7